MTVTTFSPHKPNKRAGRPPSDDPRNRTVTTRLTAHEQARFVAVAEGRGLRVGAAARAALLEFMERVR